MVSVFSIYRYGITSAPGCQPLSGKIDDLFSCPTIGRCRVGMAVSRPPTVQLCPTKFFLAAMALSHGALYATNHLLYLVHRPKVSNRPRKQKAIVPVGGTRQYITL